MRMPVKTARGTYDIILERGALARAGELLSLDRKVLVVTDDGVPPIYAQTVAAACREAVVYTIPQGERSKQADTFLQLLEALVRGEFTRTDCVVAVGGGVVGDLAGFAAACYMRGIAFYNVPTTLLSQVDSSIGGKTAIDFMGLKNLVGAFYPPQRVLIDPDLLATLPPRQIANGMAEVIKMALTSDAELFSMLETTDTADAATLDEVIVRALRIKRAVVEKDETETGLRKILNFGHTLAHAMESVYEMEEYYHGECVAIGMVPTCSAEVRERLLPVLARFGLPSELRGGAEALIDACRHDKKASGKNVTIVYVPQVGSFELQTISFDELERRIRQVLGE